MQVTLSLPYTSLALPMHCVLLGCAQTYLAVICTARLVPRPEARPVASGLLASGMALPLSLVAQRHQWRGWHSQPCLGSQLLSVPWCAVTFPFLATSAFGLAACSDYGQGSGREGEGPHGKPRVSRATPVLGTVTPLVALCQGYVLLWLPRRGLGISVADTCAGLIGSAIVGVLGSFFVRFGQTSDEGAESDDDEADMLTP